MDCAAHPGAKAVDTCIKCQRAICAGCRQIVSGQAMCSFCLNAAKQTDSGGGAGVVRQHLRRRASGFDGRLRPNRRSAELGSAV